MLEDDTIDMPVLCQARAKAAHQAVDENELTLEPGQLVEVLEKGDSGWWLARSENGSVGWAPSNYLTEIVHMDLLILFVLGIPCFSSFQQCSLWRPLQVFPSP
jgi:hypothetical protein